MGMPAQCSLVAQAEQQDKIAADWMLNYETYKHDLDMSIEEITHRRETCLSGVRGSMPGDDTGNRGRALAADEIVRKQKWVGVVASVEQALPQHLQVFLKLRRDYRHRKGPNGWMPIVQIRYATEMARMTHGREENTYRSASRLADYWDEIVNYTVRRAIAEGLLGKGRNGP